MLLRLEADLALGGAAGEALRGTRPRMAQAYSDMAEDPANIPRLVQTPQAPLAWSACAPSPLPSSRQHPSAAGRSLVRVCQAPTQVPLAADVAALRARADDTSAEARVALQTPQVSRRAKSGPFHSHGSLLSLRVTTPA